MQFVTVTLKGGVKISERLSSILCIREEANGVFLEEELKRKNTVGTPGQEHFDEILAQMDKNCVIVVTRKDNGRRVLIPKSRVIEVQADNGTFIALSESQKKFYGFHVKEDAGEILRDLMSDKCR